MSGEKVSVEFSLNRLISRVCHRAVDLISSQRLFSIVFPSEFYQKPKNLRWGLNVVFFSAALKFYHNRLILSGRCPFKNPKVEENREQHRAVRNIVNNTAFPAPYIIYGPPGTGKTSTIVEAITQVCTVLRVIPSLPLLLNSFLLLILCRLPWMWKVWESAPVHHLTPLQIY